MLLASKSDVRTKLIRQVITCLLSQHRLMQSIQNLGKHHWNKTNLATERNVVNIWLTRSSHSRSNITTHDLYFATVSNMITLLPKDGPLVSLNPLKVLTIKWKMSCRPYRNNRDQEAKNDVGILGEGTERERFQSSKNKSLYSSSSCYQKAGSQKAKDYICDAYTNSI